MKFFESVFLLILGSSPLIKITLSLSINCRTTDIDGANFDVCESKVKELNQSASAENQNKIKSELFACLRNVIIKQKDEACADGATGCGTLTIKLKDQTNIVVKMCDNSELLACDGMKKGLDDLFRTYGTSDFVKDSRCDLKPSLKPSRSAVSSSTSPSATAVFILASITIHILI